MKRLRKWLRPGRALRLQVFLGALIGATMAFALINLHELNITYQKTRSLEAIHLEQTLIKGLTRLLRQAGRDPLGLGVVIEYLWKIQLAAHNQVLRKTLAEDRAELFEETLLL